MNVPLIFVVMSYPLFVAMRAMVIKPARRRNGGFEITLSCSDRLGLRHYTVGMMINIAMVEDDERVRRSMARAIEASGRMQLVYETDQAGQALLWMNDHMREPPHVWLVDLGLPDGNGLDVIKAASRHCPDSQIMVVSMFGDEAKVLDSIAAGATGYLLKGQGDEDLVEHIDDMLDGGSPISPLIARQLLQRMKASRSFTRAVEGAPGQEPPVLTEREQMVLQLIARGYSYDEVAAEAALSPNTVRHHIKNIYSKLSVHSKNGAIFEATKRGWIRMD